MKEQGKIEQYLKESFGWKTHIYDFNIYRDKLPYALLLAADYGILEIEGLKFVIIKPANEDFRNTKNLVVNIERRINLPVVVVLDSIDTYQRKSLIESKINFIIPERQLYVPTIGILLNERGMGHRNTFNETLSSISTMVLLMHLNKKTIEGKSVSEIAKEMGYSIKTLSLAVNELEKAGFIRIKALGRKKLIEFTLSPEKLWEKFYAISESPVEKVLYTSKEDIASQIGIKSSDTALSEMSMLTSPSNKTFAVYERDKRIKELELNPSVGTTVIEVWKTDPKLNAKNGNADIFSLALTYKEDDDPRIRKELNKLIEELL